MQKQQGDVTLEKVNNLPDGAKLKKADKKGFSTARFLKMKNPSVPGVFHVEGFLVKRLSRQ